MVFEKSLEKTNKRLFLDSLIITTKEFQTLSDEELLECAQLFSTQYGIYSLKEIPVNNYGKGKEGQPIKFSSKMYKFNYFKDSYYISMAHYEGALIAHAIYFRKYIDGEGTMSWIVQLVVHDKYTNCGIASRLLHSAWGFSSDVAWGLATSNPLTVKTLESATFRKVSLKAMERHRDKIEKIAKYIPFAINKTITIDNKKAIIDTEFYVDHSKISENIEKYRSNWELGELPEGHEWIAFTFKGQDIDLENENNKKNFNKMIEFHESTLKEAYSRMDMCNQGWTKRTAPEINFILSKTSIDTDSEIVDFGCGHGRHLIELAKRGYQNLKGFDFSETNIQKAKQKALEMGAENIFFASEDVREYTLNKKANLILCLYDVIGSYHNENDNRAILRNIFANLCTGGKAVISVMNMELTKNIAHYKVADITKYPKSLFNLKASNTMQKTGYIFNPEYYLIDEKTGLVYRKEEFSGDGLLAAEYVIRDKRYTMSEITNLAKNCGFEILETSYVRSGQFEIPLKATDLKAKEILLFLKKN